MNSEKTTNTEMDAQFQERNKNLKADVNQLVDKATTTKNNIVQNIESHNQADEDIKNATHNHMFDKSMGSQRRTSWMDSIRSDIDAMHSNDPDRFGFVSSRFDETFGGSL